jgi:hypothetical protein
MKAAPLVVEKTDYELARELDSVIANQQFEELRVELLAREAERKRLWGNTYPFVYTRKIQPPPVEEKPKRKPKSKKKVAK